MPAANSALDAQLSTMPIKQPLEQAVILQTLRIAHSADLDAYSRDWFEEQRDAGTGQVLVQTRREILRIAVDCLPP